jgi:membrane associated rhomboid family serine protease
MSFNSSGNSFQRNSPIVFWLIVVNVGVFVIQLLQKKYNFTQWGALHHYSSTMFKPHQIITNMFMHDIDNSIFVHLFFNMFCLYTFGTNLEKVWGSKKFLNFYMICGIGASIIMMLSIPYSSALNANNVEVVNLLKGTESSRTDFLINISSAVGASGALMGIAAAFAYLFPNTEMMIMFIPMPIKVKYLIPVFILIDLFGGFGFTKGGNVGHFAHLGGALVGFLLVVYWNKTNKKTFY